jgi:acyl dehydratase
MAGLGGVVLHGLCTLAWATDAFARFLGDPGLVTGVKARFSKPVRPEESIHFEGTVTEADASQVRARVVARNPVGEEVLKNVELTGLQPSASVSQPAISTGASAPLGRSWGPFRYTVGLEKMREYAAAISGGVPSYAVAGLPEDLHPVRHDVVAGARSRWGSVIAFPLFAVLFSIAPAQAALLDPALGIDVFRVLHGEQEFEFREVLRPGDVLETTGRLEERSARGKNEVLVLRTDSVNQYGRLAVRGRFTAFIRG